jgi:pyrroloquinoline-quinone synthase
VPGDDDQPDVQNAEKWPETRNLIDTFGSVCRDRSTAEGLAALYAYESQIPEICESKIDGLRKHYGVTNPEHCRYFAVHIEADHEHSAAERKRLSRYVDNRDVESVKASGDALWEMLSGVCRCHAIAC